MHSRTGQGVFKMRALKYLWASPVILVGLLAASLWALAGTRMRWDRGALVIIDRGPIGRWMIAHKWGGVTIGLTILLWVYDSPIVEYHERVHVRQVLRWGMLFPIIYFMSLALHGYNDNVFEKQAFTETMDWWQKG